MNKNILFIFAFLLIGFASAASLTITNSSTIPSSVTSPSSFSITYLLNYTSTTSETVTISFSAVNPTGSVSLPASTTISSNELKNVTATYSVPSGASGTYSSTITATSGSLSSSKSFSSSIVTSSSDLNSTKICRYGTNNSLISIDEITDDSDLDDEFEWRPLDDIKIEVEFENTGDDEEDYTVSLMFFDSEGKDVSDEVADDEDNLEIDVSNLDEGDSEKVQFEFSVNPEVDDGNYKIVAKVIKEGREKEQCVFAELDEELTVEKDDRSVIVKTVEGQNTASCGDLVQFSVDLANIGSEDEDQAKVILFNKELGLNLFKEVEELDEGDSDSVLFQFEIPNTAKEGLYRLTFSTEFDYDDDDETYDEESDTDDDVTYSINVLGNCGIASNENKPAISAKLLSTAKVNNELTVEVTIRNSDSKAGTFIVAANNYQTWATASSTTQVLNLAAQESKTTQIKLIPTESGQQTFTLEVTSNGQTYDQPVTINVAGKSSLSLGSASATTYLIAGIILLVVLIILILIIKALRPSKQEDD